MNTDPGPDRHLESAPVAEGLFRVESAAALKRFFHVERALTIACAAWIPWARRLETKAALAQAAWEDALTAEALKQRIYELKYPDRSLEVGPDRSFVLLFEAGRHAPSVTAFLDCLSSVQLGAVLQDYREYLSASDEVADGPTHRFLRQAVADHTEQVRTLQRAAATEGPPGREWTSAMGTVLDEIRQGGESPDVVLPGRPWRLPEAPGRDERYFANRFYWPDNFDAAYPYGEGMRLQLRSAISHLNEVWAVDVAAANLVMLSPSLGWAYTLDAARWLYDESRHMMMGQLRLDRWGLTPREIPLGHYIYDACQNEEPLLRLAMLAYFETKNIGRKRDRVMQLHALGDQVSARDMDFDWADEGIHASYGRKWMKAALAATGRSPEEWPQLLDRCEQLVAAQVSTSTAQERAALTERAQALIRRAEELSQGRGA